MNFSDISSKRWQMPLFKAYYSKLKLQGSSQEKNPRPEAAAIGLEWLHHQQFRMTVMYRNGTDEMIGAKGIFTKVLADTTDIARILNDPLNLTLS